jgi:hypothetical protein
MNSKVLIIAGMHRSGTSVVTQWLNRCGLFIGNNLLGPGIGNEQGHFEDADFLNLHQKFLKKRNFPDTGFITKATGSLTEIEQLELKGMLETKNRKHHEWGWKDPRTCLFLGEYSKLIPSAYYVIVVRNFNATVSSLITREFKMNEKRFQQKRGLSKLKWQLFKRKSLEKIFEKETDRFLKVWVHYYEELLQHARSLPTDSVVFLNYNTLMKADEDIFSTIRDQWHFAVHYFPFTNVYKKELLSEEQDIKKYIKNKDLEARALAIEEYMMQHYAL